MATVAGMIGNLTSRLEPIKAPPASVYVTEAAPPRRTMQPSSSSSNESSREDLQGLIKQLQARVVALETAKPEAEPDHQLQARVAALEMAKSEPEPAIASEATPTREGMAKSDAEPDMTSEATHAWEIKAETAEEEPPASADALFNLYNWAAYTALKMERAPLVINSVALATLLLFTQIIFAFGVFDVAQLLISRDDTAAYSPAIDNAWAYVDNSFYIDHPGDGGQARLPVINFYASLVSLWLMVLIMRTDNEGTLLSNCPLEALVLPEVGGDGSASRSSIRQRLSRALLGIILQMYWTVRAAVLPTFSVVGAALTFANSDDALDIVLNSVAFGFIFELDDMLYPQLVSRSQRESYEEEVATRPSASSPFVVKGAQRAIFVTNSLIAILDFVIALMVYLQATAVIAQGSFQVPIIGTIHVMVRTSLLGLCEGAIAYLARKEVAMDRKKLYAYIALFVVLLVAFTAFVYTFTFAIMELTLGNRWDLIMVLPDELNFLRPCLDKKGWSFYGEYDEFACIDLHTDNTKQEALGNVSLFEGMRYFFQIAMASRGLLLQRMGMYWRTATLAPSEAYPVEDGGPNEYEYGSG